ncbi:MAG: hypothetical protein ACRC0L_00460 [Angustibacter sp.]
MSFEFRVQADAAELRRAAVLVDDLAELFRVNGPKIAGTPEVFAGDSWSGQTRDRVVAELEGLGARMSTLPALLQRVAGQLRTTAVLVDRITGEVFQLNKSFEIAAAKEYTSGNRRSARMRYAEDAAEAQQIEKDYWADVDDAQGTMRGLRVQFDEKQAELHTSFVTLGEVLAEETVVKVPAAVVAAFRSGGGDGAALWRYPPPVGILPADLGVDDLFGATQPLLADRTTMADARAAAELTVPAAGGDAAARETLKKISAKYANNPLFSAEFAKTLGAKGYAEAGRALTERFAATTPGTGEEEQVSADNTWLAGFLGGTLNDAADTRNDSKLSLQQREEIKAWRDQTFLPELKAVGRNEYQIEHGDGAYYGYWMLGQLVHAGAKAGHPPGPDFMTVVGRDLLMWDTEFNEPGATNYPSWSSPWGPFAPAPVAHRSGFTITSEQSAADPINEILRASSYDRKSAQAFLTADMVVAGKSTDALDYLMKERRQPTKGGLPYNDKGAALGTAIRAADMDRNDKTGTEIASKLVNNYMTGLKEGKVDPWGMPKTNNYADAMGGLRPVIGDVVAYHIDDVSHTIYHGEKPGFEAYVEGKPLEYNLQIEDAPKIAHLIADLAADRPGDIADLDADPPNAIQKIVFAQLQFTQSRLIPLANDTHRMSVEAGKQAHVLGYLRRSGEIGLEAQARNKDEINKMIQGIAKAGVDLIPPAKFMKGMSLGGVVGGPILDKSLNKLLPVDHLSKYQRKIPAGERQIDTLYDRGIQEAVRSRTVWAKGTSPQEWLAGPGQHHGPEGKFTDAEGKIIARENRTEAQEEAFDDWWKGESSSEKEGGANPSLSVEADEISNAANSGFNVGFHQAGQDSR